MNILEMVIGGLITLVIILILLFTSLVSYDIGQDKVYQEAIEHGCGNYIPTTNSKFKKFKWEK